MGLSITVSCKKCSAEDDFLVGIGMSHFEIESVLPHLRGKSKETLKGIIDKQQIIDSQYGYEVFVCDNCNTLHNRFYVKVEYEDGNAENKVFETHFKCGKCRKELVKIDEEIEQVVNQYNCKKCGAKALEQELGMLWD